MVFKNGISIESTDLLAAMDGSSLYSPFHNGPVKIKGNKIIKDGVIVMHLESDDEIQSLWQEYYYQHGLEGNGGSK